MRLITTLAIVALTSPAAADDKPAIRALDLKNVVFKHDGNIPEPVEVKSAEELKKCKAFADDASRAAIEKQVDFAKEKLVAFAWSGSGGDRLAPILKTADKKPVAVFTYTAGLTDDIRRHGLVFAVPKDAAVEVMK